MAKQDATFAIDNPFARGVDENPFSSGPLSSARNPFAPPARRSNAVADDAPEGSYEYQLMKSADLPVEGCETPSSAVEVRILWGRNLLSLQHLSPPR